MLSILLTPIIWAVVIIGIIYALLERFLKNKTVRLIARGLFALFLLFIGAVLVRRVCALPGIFFWKGIIPICVGIGLVLLGSFLCDVLLREIFGIRAKAVFLAVSLFLLGGLSFTGGYSSLYSLVRRLGHGGGLTPSTKIVVESELQCLSPEKALEVADSYLKGPIPEVSGPATSDLERFKSHEKTVKLNYRGSWVRKAFVSPPGWEFLELYEGDEGDEPVISLYQVFLSPNYEDSAKTEEIYETSFLVNSALHWGSSNTYTVYMDCNGNVVAIGSLMLK